MCALTQPIAVEICQYVLDVNLSVIKKHQVERCYVQKIIRYLPKNPLFVISRKKENGLSCSFSYSLPKLLVITYYINKWCNVNDLLPR